MLFVEITEGDNTHRLSLDGIDGGTYFWDAQIVSISRFDLQHGDSGGLVRPTKGSISLTPDLSFTSGTIRVYWSDSGDDTALTLVYTGYMLRTSITTTAVGYKIYEQQYGVDLLDDGVDETGETVVVPMATGSVTHRTPQRTGTGTEYRYYKSGINGTKHTHWHCYDDGVDICANVTETATTGTGTFTLSVAPVGEVTVSGTGTVTDLDEWMAWACARLGYTYSGTLGKNPSPALDFWADTQTPLATMIDQVAGYCNHIIYDDEAGTMRLVDRDANNGSRTVDEFGFFEAPLSEPNPIKLMRAAWTTRKKAAQVAVLQEERHEITVTGPVEVGQEITITAYNESEALVRAAMETLMSSWTQSRGEIVMPIGERLILPGQLVTWTDDQHPTPISVAIRARRLSYDFEQETVTVSGEGAWS